MFARRKKPRDEDEPLVPHGLVWHATNAPEVAPEPMSPQNTARKPIEMPARLDRCEEELPQPEVPPLSALNPPLTWPKLDGSDVATDSAEIVTAVSFPHRKPPATVPAAPIDDSEPPAPALFVVPKKEEEEATPVAVPESVNPLERLRSGISPAFANLRAGVQHAGQLVSKGAASLGHAARRTYSSLALPDKIASAKEFSRLQTQKLRAIPVQEKLHQRTNALRNAATEITARSRSQASSLRSQAAARMNNAAGLWRRNYKIRVRLAGTGRLRLIASRVRARSAGLVPLWQRNVRLGTSMLMAALSAVLVLLMITGLRHFTVRASNAAPTSTQISVAKPALTQPALTQTAPTQPAIAQPAAAPATSAVSASAGSAVVPASRVVQAESKSDAIASSEHSQTAKPSVVAAARKPTPRRHRSSEDDDYVAPDTYRYYGASGKPSK